MLPFVESLVRQITLTTLLDIAITAILIYWLFSLIRGRVPSRLVIGVSVLFGHLRPAQLLACGCSPGSSRPGRSWGSSRSSWCSSRSSGEPWSASGASAPGLGRRAVRAARGSSRSRAWSPRPPGAAREGHGALIVLERETGLEEIAETGVMLHSDLSHELLTTIFTPRTALHDGAVIVRGGDMLAAARCCRSPR